MNFFLKQIASGKERKLDRLAKKLGKLCAHFICLPASLPPFLPADFNEQAGRQAEPPRVFTIKCAPQDGFKPKVGFKPKICYHLELDSCGPIP